MNGKLLKTLAAAWLMMTTAGVTADDDWHTWRGPNRDGKSPSTGLLKQWPEEGPDKLWEFNELGRGFSTVAISDGVIYATGDVGGEATTVERRGRKRAAVEGGHLTLFALNMDGEVQWTKTIDEAWTRNHPGTRSTPTIDGDRLYHLTGHGLITCRDKKTGVEYDMMFFAGEDQLPSKGAVTYEPIGSKTRVTWTMKGEMNIPIMGGWYALTMEPVVGPYFDEGLAKLKKKVEAD